MNTNPIENTEPTEITQIDYREILGNKEWQE